MTYELAKQLKDAGFPQDEFKEGYFLWNRMGRERAINVSRIKDFPNHEETSYAPTLSELIEVCRTNQYGAFVLHENKERNDWKSMMMNSIPSGPTPYEHNLDIEVRGSTPEEVVAKLWLTLNKVV